MVVGFNPGLLGNPAGTFGSPIDSLNARNPGPVIEYKYKSAKPKKQLKEIRKILLPEKKKFLFLKYGFKFNMRHRCVVCGSLHEWEMSDPMRPPLPLSQVNKGRPLQGNYCPKHAAMFKQMEMLEQKILAEENGLEFRNFIPKPKMPVIKSGPATNLNQSDIASLISLGWVIEPPRGTKEGAYEQYTRLMLDVQGKLAQIQKIIPMMEVENNGEE
mgnify:FL=1|tara:strand:- start:404 stop:1048 length:645 start_codon:yes stop_codon:yes gene_type:complete